MDSLPLECPECGERFPAESRFCPHDGAGLFESGAPTLVFDTDEARGRGLDNTTADGAESDGVKSSSVPSFDDEYTQEDDSSRVAPRLPAPLPPPPARPAPQKDSLLGAMVGSYRVEGLLGQGGMGRIYRAVHVSLGKPVAIKVLRVEVAGEDEANMRFIREARSMSALGHPNIVDVLDFGALEDGRSYFVMELLEGASLYHVVKTLGRLGPQRALRMVERLTSALHAAHSQGVVHRDLKPGNVFVCGDINRSSEVKLLDFGIAKIADATIRLTVAGSIFGTPQYMAPEQCLGVEVDHRADIYALGIMLFEMLTGKPPFDSAVPVEILIQQRSSPVPTLPREFAVLQPLITRVLAKSPDDRFQTMREFGIALDEASDALNAPSVPAQARIPSSAPQPSQPPVPGFSAQAQPPQGGGTPQGQPRELAKTMGFDYELPAASAPLPYANPPANPAPSSAPPGQPNALQRNAQPHAPNAALAQPPLATPVSPPRGRLVLLVLGALSVVVIGAGLVITFGTPNEEIAPHAMPLAPAALINVSTEPPGAQLYSGDSLVGVTPCPISRPTTDQEFRVTLTGHADEVFTLGPSSPDVHTLVLVPSP